MMFKSLLTVSTLAVLAVATEPIPPSQCNTGNLQCCQSTQDASSSAVATALGPLAVLLAPLLNGLAGLTCTPLSLVGLNANSCTAQPVCCTNNYFSGAVVLGCTPVNLSL